jgi:dihydroneopterin aldolase
VLGGRALSANYLYLNNIELFLSVGINPAEQLSPQLVKIDLKLFFDLSPSSISDQLRDTVDYAALLASLQEFATSKHWNLIESLAHDLAQHLLATFPLEAVEINLSKPKAFSQPIIPGIVLRRSR